MSNRFASVALITLVSMIGAVILFIIGLFMFPGIRLFGIRYVSLNGRIVASLTADGSVGPVSIGDKLVEKYGESNGNYSGIVINCYEIPVEITFNDNTTHDYSIEYYDNFNGLTTSDIEYPSLSFEKDDNGNAVINISEFKTFIYESSTSKRYIKLYIPLKDVSTESDYTRDITINSTRSSVSFTKNEGDSRIPKLDDVSIITSGNVSFGTKIYAKTLEYVTNNSIYIDKDCSNCIDASSYKLVSKNGGVTVEKDNIANLEIETNQGDIKFRSCAHFTGKTNYGNISYAFIENEETEGKGISVSGKVDITSKTGSVTIKNMIGSSIPASISTTSGHVVVEKMYDGKIVTKRGLIDVKSCRILEIETNTGKVFVTEATSSLKVNTVRSNIYLGSSSEKKVIRNADIFTRIGKVEMYGAYGSAKIETLSSNVVFRNAESTEINIKCGGKLDASGLKGTVDVYAEENSNLSFDDLTMGNVTLDFGSKCSNVEIEATNNYRSSVNYHIKGSNVSIYERQNDENINLSKGVDMKNDINSSVRLKVTSNANINIYFKDSTGVEG